MTEIGSWSQDDSRLFQVLTIKAILAKQSYSLHHHPETLSKHKVVVFFSSAWMCTEMFLLVFCSCICEEAQIKSYLVLLYCRESRHLHRSHSVAHAKTIRMMNSPTGTRKMCNFSWNVSLMAFFYCRAKTKIKCDWRFLTFSDMILFKQKDGINPEG